MPNVSQILYTVLTPVPPMPRLKMLSSVEYGIFVTVEKARTLLYWLRISSLSCSSMVIVYHLPPVLYGKYCKNAMWIHQIAKINCIIVLTVHHIWCIL
nr:MAG TPA: hypothetical protein [Caudoviricetes sp.]